ncbi:hypothetical protein GH714_035618 [Hevea brasiliensis]|uniref:Uncharacterized protein n=1 Tax=Hevea brasiliensis TaxID=3981 RepID=A0A6A6KVI1_HEVBR|nr:hypothetical protein GH714_035618 [Hevea brasiliensis]
MPSIEALAMAGVDCGKCGINLAERERRDLEKPPLYLLAEENPGKETQGNEKDNEVTVEKWEAKAKLEAWAKPVASSVKNVTSIINATGNCLISRAFTIS